MTGVHRGHTVHVDADILSLRLHNEKPGHHDTKAHPPTLSHFGNLHSFRDAVYLVEAEKVYISVPQIYSGQHVPNFITIGQVL